ncbi:hypothetical protein [Streptomyces sp. NPDC057412]
MTTAAPRSTHPDRLGLAVGGLVGGGVLGALTDRAPRSRTAVQEAAR